NYRILGWLENGFRHISNRLHPVRQPSDLVGMRIRVLPSRVQAHTFELLGAQPMPMDLTEAIALIKKGEIDAQENPLSIPLPMESTSFIRSIALPVTSTYRAPSLFTGQRSMPGRKILNLLPQQRCTRRSIFSASCMMRKRNAPRSRSRRRAAR